MTNSPPEVAGEALSQFDSFWQSPVEGGCSYAECYGESHRLVAQEAYFAARASLASTAAKADAGDAAELREALQWAMRRINRLARHQSHEGDGELYQMAHAVNLAASPKTNGGMGS